MSAAKPLEIVTQEEMQEWYLLTEELTVKKAREMELRKKIFGAKFPNPEEGTNNFPMDGGWVLKGQYKIDRKVDEALLTALSPMFRDHKLPIKELIKMKPELSITEYKKLTEEQKKLFNQALIIKPGAPALEIVKPKRAIT